MKEVKPITNEIERKAAFERIQELYRTPDRDASQLRETEALAEALEEFEMQHPFWQTPTDAVHEIEFMLDQGHADLPGLLEIFGGRGPFMEFMLRKQPLDKATMTAILAKFDTKREWLDKPFCEQPGWESLLDGEWLMEALDALDAAAEHRPEPELATALD